MFHDDYALFDDVEHVEVEVDPELRGDPTSGLHNFARITPALFGQFSFVLDQDSECNEYGVPKAPRIIIMIIN